MMWRYLLVEAWGREDLGCMKKNKNRFRKQELIILMTYG